MKRVHIVGCPRSGTTLLMELASTCFRAGGYCEHELSIFAAVPEVEGVYFTKQPNDIKQIRHIFYDDPDLHIIYLGRDPRAVISSKHRESPEQYFCNYRVWRECEDCALLYEDHPRFLRLRYEDLVSDPDAVQQEIQARFAFLESRYPFSEFQAHARPSAASQRAMNGLRAVNQESLQKWRQHLPRIAHQLAAHPQMQQDLERLAYEADDGWTAILEGVEPKSFPCRYPERKPWLKYWERDLRVYLKSRRYLRRLRQAG